MDTQDTRIHGYTRYKNTWIHKIQGYMDTQDTRILGYIRYKDIWIHKIQGYENYKDTGYKRSSIQVCKIVAKSHEYKYTS